MKVLTSSGTSYTVKYESGHYFIMDTDSVYKAAIIHRECCKPEIDSRLFILGDPDTPRFNRYPISTRITKIE